MPSLISFSGPSYPILPSVTTELLTSQFASKEFILLVYLL